MIRVEAVSKKFGKLQVLQQVDLTCNSGECIALIGPNGCGKTTLIKSILNMVIPDSGRILVNEKDISGDYLYRSDIGYMPQIGRYPENMNVGQVIETIQTLRGAGKAVDTDLYDAYQMSQLLSKRMNTLSGGTRQKVSAVLAFMFNPGILILDEPTAGLDPLAAEILKEKIMAEMQRKKLVMITSHLLSELEDIVSEVVFMQDGTVAFHKSNAALKADTGKDSIAKAISHILREQAS